MRCSLKHKQQQVTRPRHWTNLLLSSCLFLIPLFLQVSANEKETIIVKNDLNNLTQDLMKFFDEHLIDNELINAISKETNEAKQLKQLDALYLKAQRTLHLDQQELKNDVIHFLASLAIESEYWIQAEVQILEKIYQQTKLQTPRTELRELRNLIKENIESYLCDNTRESMFQSVFNNDDADHHLLNKIKNQAKFIINSQLWSINCLKTGEYITKSLQSLELDIDLTKKANHKNLGLFIYYSFTVYEIAIAATTSSIIAHSQEMRNNIESYITKNIKVPERARNFCIESFGKNEGAIIKSIKDRCSACLKPVLHI